MRLSARVGDDNYREITLLRASIHDRLWLIPIEQGMVGYPNTAEDRHHLATFNDLLRASRLKITNENVSRVPIHRPDGENPGPPSTLHQLLSKNDSAGSVAQKDGVTDFIHRESHGDTWTHSYLVGSFDIPLRTRSRA